MKLKLSEMTDLEIELVNVLQPMICDIFNIAATHGWHDKKIDIPTRCVLLHSEISEAFEHYRHHNRMSDHIPDYTGVEEELADTIIRILDMAAEHKLDIVGAIIEKIRFNKTRSYKHGGKKV